ncbi:MAG: proteasome accessory factor PafA2 [Acidimicrobiales bacterium]|nr:proteasome accessory factor PafA2 [Acidimicrobiales bacterium]
MAISKICGIETEYGIAAFGEFEGNPVGASSLLVNVYATAQYRSRTDWDFDDETPGSDARGFLRQGSMAPLVETHLVNAVLTNGARLYVDHAHPEYSSPECSSALEAVIWDRAGEVIVTKATELANEFLGPRGKIICYKNNSDRKGNSYGCHENYLMDRSVPFPKIIQELVPFFISRQIIAGAGKVGQENSANSNVEFQISQRADFFEEVVGLETTIKRPIINTRDEPHAHSDRYRRLHVIIGDANMSETSTFLKLGTTALALAMIEDSMSPKHDRTPKSPIEALRQVSQDPTLSYKIEMADGSKLSALDLQEEWLSCAIEYIDHHGGEVVGGDDSASQIIRTWERVLAGLRRDILTLSKDLDWVAKYALFSAYKDRHDLTWDSPKIAAMDLQYHDLRDEKSLAKRVGFKTLVTAEQVNRAEKDPPLTTRAYFRGMCLKKWPDAIVSANWDSLLFDLGEESLQRVPMLDPLKGTEKMVGTLLKECKAPRELLDKLGA